MDQILKDSSLRSIKKMHFFMGERYPLYSYCHGTENLRYFVEICCPVTLERGEAPIAYCTV